MADITWTPLESNPETMSKFLNKLGVPDTVQIVDVYSLQPDMLDFVPQPVIALILLFPCDDEYAQHRQEQIEQFKEKGQVIPDDLFFVKQFVHNACGTIALIHSIANSNVELKEGFLKEYLNKSRPLDAVGRGEMLQNSEDIMSMHKEFASEGQTLPPDENEPVPYHFVAFVPFGGYLMELDGRKEFPINHGKSSTETFLSDAAKVCQEYMSRNPNNVNFTIVAIVSE